MIGIEFGKSYLSILDKVSCRRASKLQSLIAKIRKNKSQIISQQNVIEFQNIRTKYCII